MNVQYRSLATSTTDLRRLQHISTSTSNLTLTKDSETETENGEIDYRDEDAFSQTDSESGDSEGENSSEENAISAETTRDQEHAAQTTGDGGSCIQSAANSAQNSGRCSVSIRAVTENKNKKRRISSEQVGNCMKLQTKNRNILTEEERTHICRGEGWGLREAGWKYE